MSGRLSLCSLAAVALAVAFAMALQAAGALGDPASARVLVPAIASDAPGDGIATHLTMNVTPGTGRLYMESPPLTQPDFERAVHDAVAAGERLAGSATPHDHYFSLDVPADTIVEGPSVGVAAAVATAAALEGRTVRSDVAITGTVDAAGNVGAVGGVLEKAAAAAREGARTFIIPADNEVITLQNESRIPLGPISIVLHRETSQVVVAAVAKERFGITVIGVRTLREAFAIATGNGTPPALLAQPPLQETRPSESVQVPDVGVLAVCGVALALAGLLRPKRKVEIGPPRSRRDRHGRTAHQRGAGRYPHDEGGRDHHQSLPGR